MSHFEQLHLYSGSMKIIATVNHYDNRDATPQLTITVEDHTKGDGQSITFNKEGSSIVSTFIHDAMNRKDRP